MQRKNQDQQKNQQKKFSIQLQKGVPYDKYDIQFSQEKACYSHPYNSSAIIRMPHKESNSFSSDESQIKQQKNKLFLGSGSFIQLDGKKFICTAAHNLFFYKETGNKKQKILYQKLICFVMDMTQKKRKKFQISLILEEIYFLNQYLQSTDLQQHKHDVAFIRINNQILDSQQCLKLKFFGGIQDSQDSMQQTQNFVEFMKSIKQKQLYMMGFPYRSFVKYRGKKKKINQKINLSQLEDSPQIKLAFKRLNIKGFKDNIFYYETSTWGGQSGGPILILNKQTHEYEIIGVHTGGQKNQNKNINYGLIFNPSLLKKLSENNGTINSSQQQILQYNNQQDRQSEVISKIQSLSIYNSKINKQWKYCKALVIQYQVNKNDWQKYSGSLININNIYYLITAKVTIFQSNEGNMKCLMVKQYSQNNNKTNIVQRQYHQVNCQKQKQKSIIVDKFSDNNSEWLVKIILYKLFQKAKIKKDTVLQIQHNQTNLQKDKFFIIGFTRSKTKSQNSNSNQNTLMDYYFFQEIKIKKYQKNKNYIYYDSNSDLGLVGAGIVKGHPDNNNNFKLIGIHINSNQKTKQSFGILLTNNENFKDLFNISFKRERKQYSSASKSYQYKRKMFNTQQKTLYKPIPKINPNQVQIRSSRTMRNERRKKQQKYSRSQWSDSQFSN